MPDVNDTTRAIDPAPARANRLDSVPVQRRDHWQRTPGNPYASEATYLAAVGLVSNQKCHDLVDRSGLRDEAGRVSADQIKALFAPMLQGLGVSARERDQVDWQEVADEFNPEPAHAPAPQHPSPEEQAVETALVAGMTSEDTAQTVGARARPIDAAALAVLRECTATEQGIFLPQRQLERALYESVNKVIEALGGKWNRTLKGHKFEDDPRAVLDIALTTGQYISPKDFGYFPTPEDVGRRALAHLDLQPGHLVLEPSAGRGALADLCAEVVGKANVHVNEILTSNLKVLSDKGYAPTGLDFLAVTPSPFYDRILLNPPFGNMADVDHVLHAVKFLKPDGKLVAITSPSHTFRTTTKAQTFQRLMNAAGVLEEEVEAGAFRASGTDVRTVILSIDAASVPSEFWCEEDTRRQTLGQVPPARPRG